MKKIALLLVFVAISAASSAPAAADLRGEDSAIVHVLNRLGFGPRPGDVETVRSIGLQRYIDLQLHPDRIANSALNPRLEHLTTVNMSAQELVLKYQMPLLEARRQQRQRPVQGDQPEMATPPSGPDPAVRQLANAPMLELTEQKLLRAIYSERQLEEVLVDFWFNHFNVDARKGPVRFMLTEYERETIRPHVLGRFRDLLERNREESGDAVLSRQLDERGSEEARAQNPRRPFPRGAAGRLPIRAPAASPSRHRGSRARRKRRAPDEDSTRTTHAS